MTDSYADDVEQMAQEIIQIMGKESATVARRQAETVAGLGDTISAQVWSDVADAIDRIRGRKRSKTAA